MRLAFFILLISVCSMTFGQQNEKISTIDFVQILNDNKEEVVFYYQNNWRVLREMAIKKSYIHSYQVLEVPATEEEPFHFMLITTYLNQEQYSQREDHFDELIEEKGDLKLLNEKKPGDFRKVLFGKDGVRHWN